MNPIKWIIESIDESNTGARIENWFNSISPNPQVVLLLFLFTIIGVLVIILIFKTRYLRKKRKNVVENLVISSRCNILGGRPHFGVEVISIGEKTIEVKLIIPKNMVFDKH